MPAPALSLAQVRMIERGALAEGLPLMQRAGAAAAVLAESHLPAGGRVLALAGPGNNGGDALVAARILSSRGFQVEVVMPGDPARFPPDAAQAYAQWRSAGGLERPGLPDPARDGFPDLVIDGLFGIGLARRLGEPWQSIVDTVNGWRRPVLALDIPSGLEAETGQSLGRPVRANWTIAFISAAQALSTPQGRIFAGDVTVERLGLTDAMIDRYLSG